MAVRELRSTGGGNFFKWEKVGTEFAGQFKAIGTGEYKGKVTFHGVFVGADGKTTKVNAPTVLHGQLEQVESGEFVRIIYTGDGEKKSGQSPAKLFDVRAGSSLNEVLSAPRPGQAAPQAQSDVYGKGPSGVSADALAAAMAKLKGASASPYDALVAKLRAHDKDGADALIEALVQIYPDAAARETALADHLKAQGVA